MKFNYQYGVVYMFNKLCVLLSIILLECLIVFGYNFERMDLETCLGQFDVHRDTIIRTEESQAIGGKYIQGIGLSNLDECQRLCCETEHCDVYIFEEKAEGYCYLFECGPPENFHCKFTRHANYTSAVLTPIKHTVTLPPSTPKPPIIIHKPPLPSIHSQISSHQIPPATTVLSQHELELTNLKQKPDFNIQQSSKTFTTSIPSLGVDGSIRGGTGNGAVGGGIHQSEQIATLKNSQMKFVCGSFQFQCHSGECIAVYNTCDGIPQCKDGSDEGPECPTTTGVEGKSINAETNKLTNYRIPAENSAFASVGLSKQIMQSLPRQYQQQPVNQNPILNNREDPMSAPSLWQNRKAQDDQTEIERNNHIFNHKGGLQLPANNLGSQYINSGPNIYNPLQRDIYMQPDIQNPYRNPIIQPQDHMIPPSNLNWQQAQQIQQQQQPPPPQQQQQQSLIPPGPYVIAVNGQPVPQIKSIPSITSSSSQSQSQSQINNINNNNNNDNNNDDDNIQIHKLDDSVVKKPHDHHKSGIQSSSSAQLNENGTNKKINHQQQQQQQQHEKDHNNEKESSEDSDDYSYYEEKPTDFKQRKHKKISSKDKEKSNKGKNKEHKNDDNNNVKSVVEASVVHERYKMIKEDLEMEFVDHDGQSERPGGAVLSLTLGLIVTAALAILIGCRMRTVGRRVRRIGKTPYANDADFLVNGMYL